MWDEDVTWQQSTEAWNQLNMLVVDIMWSWSAVNVKRTGKLDSESGVSWRAEPSEVNPDLISGDCRWRLHKRCSGTGWRRSTSPETSLNLFSISAVSPDIYALKMRVSCSSDVSPEIKTSVISKSDSSHTSKYWNWCFQPKIKRKKNRKAERKWRSQWNPLKGTYYAKGVWTQVCGHSVWKQPACNPPTHFFIILRTSHSRFLPRFTSLRGKSPAHLWCSLPY